MAANEATLYARMELRLADAEKKLAKFQGNVDNNMANMERRTRRAAKNVESSMANMSAKIGGLAKASIGGLLAGIVGAGAAGIVSQLGDIARGVAEIGDAAKVAGLSSKAFQEWQYVAEQARIPIDAMTDGLKELNIRADEFATTGKGSAAEAFARLGMTPQEVKEKLKDPSELMLILIERTRQLGDAAAGVRIFDELFGGTGGERMVSLIDQGEAGIRRQIQAANDFGRVLSDDVIQKAGEIDRQFNAISQTVGVTLKSAIVSVVSSMVDFLESLRSVENQRDSTIQKSINDIMAQKQEVAKALADVDSADSKMSERQRARARGTHEERMRQLNEQENAYIRELESRPSVMTFKPSSDSTWTPPKYAPPVTPPSKGDTKAERTRENAIKDAERERAAVTDLIDDLKLELQMVGMSAVEKEKMNALRQAGTAATAEEKAQISSLIDTINARTEAEQRATDAAAEARDMARDFAGTIVDGFTSGAKATDVLANALKNLASRLADNALDNLFGIGGAKSGGCIGRIGSLISEGISK